MHIPNAGPEKPAQVALHTARHAEAHIAPQTTKQVTNNAKHDATIPEYAT